ncbi:hypothetical protein ACFPYJ_01840 [Paenibacillus solisilvae]|uniref:Uncharacterized protein n=1 Tax=Paenibacillus solisilvae TaxID=2486751 RepID=A0ABW0VUK7_9BACL
MTKGEFPLLMSVCLILSIVHWVKVRNAPKNEIVASLTILAVGWVIAVLLFIVPSLPGPTQLVDFIFRPLGKFLDRGS